MATTAAQVAALAQLRTALRHFFTGPAFLLRKEPRCTLPTALATIEQLNRQNAQLRAAVEEFCTPDGRAFATVINREIAQATNHASDVAYALARRVGELTPENLAAEYDGLSKALDRYFETIDRCLNHVPVNWTSVTIPKGDRLAATLHLAHLFSLAQTRLDIVDRYLDETPLLFMRDLPRALPIRLFTTAGRPGNFGVAQVAPVARVASVQYPNLQLFEVSPAVFHNRSIRVDDRIFVLDQSVGDLTLIDSAHISAPLSDAAAHAELDAVVAVGRLITLT